jgi:DNA-binding transcriptional ArsR family regulator
MRRERNELSKARAKVFSALSDPLRVEIMEALRRGERCACEVVPRAEVAQPLVSRHLRILKSGGLVKDRKEGNKRMYSVTNPEVYGVIDAVTPELVDALTRRIIKQIVY